MDKGWYSKPEFLALWVHILMKANHNEREFWFNGQNVKVKRGQFVTGRNKLSQETGISPSKVERILKVFKSEQQIEQQTNNHNRLITVVCYDQFQKSEQPNGQPLDNHWTASGQPVDTNKKERIKEVKKERRKKEEKEKTAKQVSLHSILKEDWEKRYLEAVGIQCDWRAAEGATLKQLITKLRHLAKQQHEKDNNTSPVTDEEIQIFWNYFMNKLPEWYADKADLKIINSKFNAIIAEIKRPERQAKQAVEGLYEAFDLK